MTDKEVLKKLEEVEALISDSHLVYTSGQHGRAYINKDAIYPHPDLTFQVTLDMAKSFAAQDIDVVIGPTLGGIILSQWVAHHLSKLKSKEILGIYIEKTADGFEFTRGYDELVRGKKALLVEDILTTGSSIKKVIEATRALGSTVVGVSCIANRGNVSPDDLLEIPMLKSVVKIQLESWAPESCPLCKEHVPVNTKFGKGRDFVKKG